MGDRRLIEKIQEVNCQLARSFISDLREKSIKALMLLSSYLAFTVGFGCQATYHALSRHLLKRALQ